jgi:hypothetical protein
MTQADGREVPGPHGASDALGHNPKIFRLALTQLSINLRALSTSAPAPSGRMGPSVFRRGTCDRGIWTKALVFAADAGELMGFALGFRSLFVCRMGGWAV